MDGFLAAITAAMTWERFLVLWGFISTPIGWFAGQYVESKKRSEQWKREDGLRREQIALEEKRRQEERERTQVDQLRERMRDTYTRFLAGASAIVLAAELETDDVPVKALKDSLPSFALSFQQLLLNRAT